MKFSIKTLAAAILTSSALLTSSLSLANGNHQASAVYNGNLPSIQIKKNPLPDFYVLNIANKHRSGPKGILRYGSCGNDVRVTIKNRGISYRYGDQLQAYPSSKRITGGQILVSLDKIVGNRVIHRATKFVNALDQNGHQHVDFNNTYAGLFPKSGTYKMRATIRPCARGSSTKNCKLFPEENTKNNSFSVNWTVTNACPS